MPTYGFSDQQARDFLSREIDKAAASSSFYWESEDVEEAVELLVNAVAKMIAENNKRLIADLEREAKRQALSRG
jgi:hypothetical protein